MVVDCLICRGMAFHIGGTLTLKEYFLTSKRDIAGLRARGSIERRVCGPIGLAANSNHMLKLTLENPFIILNVSMQSPLFLLSAIEGSFKTINFSS